MLLPGQIADVVANMSAPKGAGCSERGGSQMHRLELLNGEEGCPAQGRGSLKTLSLETVLTDADIRRLLCILSVR
ncbi:MAG: hypothetical protein HQL63_01965 [Magnetococcales bacterium]|nr:hypothetical protein [Magnetococcales bacterium]